MDAILELSFRQPLAAGAAISSIVLGILTLLYLGASAFLYPKPLSGIPFNKEATQRILGDVPDLIKAPNGREWFGNQAIKHGSPMFQAFLRPFGRPWVFIADYYESADICMRRTKEFDRSDVTAAQFHGIVPGHHITLKTSDPQFKKNKELVRDLMNVKFLQEVSAPQVQDKVVALTELWDRKLALCHGRPFDASEDIHHAALDIIMAIAFGLEHEQAQLVHQISDLASANSQDAEEGNDNKDEAFAFAPVPVALELEAFTTLADSINIAMSSPVPKLHHFLYRNLSSNMRRAKKGRDRLINTQIARSLDRISSGRPDRSALDNILSREKTLAEKEGRKPNYYSPTIQSELLGYLIAGHETTSSALRWGTKYLSSHPDIQSRLRTALIEVYPLAKSESRIPTVHEIVSLTSSVPYLDAVVEEVVRHSSPLPITLRQAMVDTQILGAPIPKGTTVGILANGPSIMSPAIPVTKGRRSEASVAHMQKVRTFDDVDTVDFKPERWLRTVHGKGGKHQAVFDPESGPAQAFGLGPRSCFGRKLSYIEMRIYFTLLVWVYELLPLDGYMGGYEEEPSLTRVPKHVFVKLRKNTWQ